jgi:hypothetical protein
VVQYSAGDDIRKCADEMALKRRPAFHCRLDRSPMAPDSVLNGLSLSGQDFVTLDASLLTPS